MPLDIENSLIHYNHLIGEKLDGYFVEKNYIGKNVNQVLKMFKLKDNSVLYLKNKTLDSHICRIITSSGVYTRDYKENRVNYEINDDGVINKIYFG